MTATTVLIADDHPLFRSALTQAVKQCLPDAIILEAEDTDALFAQVAKQPDLELVFLDLHMPGNQGFTALAKMLNHYPDILVVMVSSENSPDIMCKALDFGAAGFIPKSSPLQEIEGAISKILDGETWLPEGIDCSVSAQAAGQHKNLSQQLAQLTPQQYTVLTMIADGQLNKQIAYELDIAESTVKKHVSAILEKLQVHNRTMAGMVYQQLKLS